MHIILGFSELDKKRDTSMRNILTDCRGTLQHVFDIVCLIDGNALCVFRESFNQTRLEDVPR